RETVEVRSAFLQCRHAKHKDLHFYTLSEENYCSQLATLLGASEMAIKKALPRLYNPERWIGRGALAWTPRHPDLSPLDYSIWEHIKALVYQTPVDDPETLLE
ncbi:hypothetical protein C0J52_21062, partial [Blattella germanica]